MKERKLLGTGGEMMSKKEWEVARKFFLTATDRLTKPRLELADKITKAIDDVNSLNSYLCLNRIDKAESNFISLQKEAIKFQLTGNSIFEFLDENEKESFNRLNKEASFRTVGHFMGMIRHVKREHRTNFMLLEHLERRLSDKRSRVHFNRAMILSLIAISISVISLIIRG